MQENGFPHSAFVFDTEAHTSSTNITGAQVPPGTLITLLQKSLVYLKIEKGIRDARRDPSSQAYANMEEIQRAMADSKSQECDVTELTTENCAITSYRSRAISCISFSPSGEKVATLQSNGVLTVKDNNGHLVVCGTPGTEIMRCKSAISWGPGSLMIAVAGDTQTTVYKDTGEVMAVIPVNATVVSFCESLPRVAIASQTDFEVGIYDIKEGVATKISGSPVHRNVIFDMAWYGNSSVATASGDNNVGVFGVSCVQLLQGHTQAVTVVAYSSSGVLASGGDEGVIYVWSDGRQTAVLKGHAGGITALVWHPVVSGLLVSASADGSVKRWDTETGECIGTMGRHTGSIVGLAFQPNGNVMVTGGTDQIIALWQFPDGRMIHAFTLRKDVRGVTFSGDGGSVAVWFDGSDEVVIPVAPYIQ